MLAKTHLASSLAIGTIPVIYFNDFFNTYLNFYLLGLTIGALFPDIDEPNSAIGRRTLLISFIINKLFKHRGITHRLLFVVILFSMFSILLPYMDSEYSFIGLGFCLGNLLHQLGDFISGDPQNKGGINYYLYPFGSEKRLQIFPLFLRCKVGGLKEHLYLIVFIMVFINNFFIIQEELFKNTF